MKVCMVSTAPPTLCGIANYCMKLTTALSICMNHEFVVLADKRKPLSEKAPKVNGHVKILRTWKYNSLLYPFEIFRSALREKPDVIHVQHEYMVFGSSLFSTLFPILLLLLRLLNKPLIVTMHSVIPRANLTASFFQKYGVGRELAFLGKHLIFLVTIFIGFFASKVVVHLQSAEKILVSNYKFNPLKIVVIPHGVDKYEFDLNKRDAKKKLGLDNKKIVLFFGFVRPTKGLEYLIEAMPAVVKQCSEAMLLIVGDYHPHLTPKGVDYLRLLKNRVHESGLGDSILFVNRFVPEEELNLFLNACDLAVFPYIEDDILGASGALSRIANFRKPIIATRVGRFADDIIDGKNGLLVPPADSTSLANGISFLLMNRETGQVMGTRFSNEAKDSLWENVAQKTLSLYEDSF